MTKKKLQRDRLGPPADCCGWSVCFCVQHEAQRARVPAFRVRCWFEFAAAQAVCLPRPGKEGKKPLVLEGYAAAAAKGNKDGKDEL